MGEVGSPVDPATSVASDDKKCPAGCVERTLNYRERNLLIGAARDYCGGKEHADYKNQSKLSRLSKLISFEETLEYFEMMTDHYEDAQHEWRRAKLAYNALRNLRDGLIKLEDFRKQHPSLQPDQELVKPPVRAPEMTPQEMRGEERVFYLPSKLDVWVQDVLKVAAWQPLAAEYAVELCAKFGVKDEDS